MVEDLEKDTANFTLVINNFSTNQQRFTKILQGFDQYRREHSDTWADLFVQSVHAGFADFINTDRTLQQL